MTREVGWRRVAFVVATGFPFVFLAAFVAYPLWQEIGGSFSSWYQLKPHGFEGTHNYAALFNDVVARVAALHSVFYLLLTVPVEVGLGLAAAWMTLRVTRGQGLLAAIFLIPLVVPWTVAGTLFYGLFNIHGVADQVSQDVFGGGSSFLWLDHPRLAFGVIVVFGIWKGAPWCYLLLLGALSTCPEEVFEAARIDGARGFSFWWRVVLPAIRPMLVFVVVLRLLAEAQTFNSVAMLTNGGPSFPGATELVGFYANVLAFGYYNFGEASAMGTLIGAVLVIVALAGWMLAFPRRVGRRRLFNNIEPQTETRATSLPSGQTRPALGRQCVAPQPGRWPRRGPRHIEPLDALGQTQSLGLSGHNGRARVAPFRRGGRVLARAPRVFRDVLAGHRNRRLEQPHPERRHGRWHARTRGPRSLFPGL